MARRARGFIGAGASAPARAAAARADGLAGAREGGLPVVRAAILIARTGTTESLAGIRCGRTIRRARGFIGAGASAPARAAAARADGLAGAREGGLPVVRAAAA